MQFKSTLCVASDATVQLTKELIYDDAFINKNRTKPEHFTRRRKLPFSSVMVMLLQKTVRSIQSHLHAFFKEFDADIRSAKASSWCSARMKLRHTAFIELNERAVLDVVYRKNTDFQVHRWNGHRLIAIDSSLVRLPDNDALGEEFGWVLNSNKSGDCGQFPQARLSALTDVLNHIVIEASFVPWKQAERDLACQHLKALEPQDVAILDRGYASYDLFAEFICADRRFVCRCKSTSFAIVRQLFKENQAGKSVVVTLRPSADKRAKKKRREGLPEEITVRFVTVRLSTGELEVLATNLLDEQAYPTEDFGELYHKRWGIETYYDVIKNRLDLQNFTGLSAEAVRQDLYSTIFLSNFESILIRPAQEELQRKSERLKNRQQVNHSVSFHAIKSEIIRLLLSDKPTSQVLSETRLLFLDNPVSTRSRRIVPRKKKKQLGNSYNYQRNVKKSVF